MRTDLNKDGNYNNILNVSFALKQVDEELYEILLHYPDTYSPQEIRGHLEKHGYKVLDGVCDGELLDNFGYFLDYVDYEDYKDCETDEEIIMRIAEENDLCVEIHTNSLENQIERYNIESKSDEVIRLYKEEDDDGNTVYSPIVKKCGQRRNSGAMKSLNKRDRIKVDVHTNPDVKVLWNITSGYDINKDICSCIIDCDVEKYDPMEVAVGIVLRKNERPYLLPRGIKNKENRNTPELIQENKDAQKLSNWKRALKGSKNSRCSDEVRDYLDTNLPGWRNEINFDEKSLDDAKAIVLRKDKRPNLLPRYMPDKTKQTTPELIQESKDAIKLNDWKKSLKGQRKTICPNELRDYLDTNLPGWRTEIDEKALEDAKDIVSRKNKRPNLLPRKINKGNQNTPELIQENKDSIKLGNWKKALKGSKHSRCSDEVRDYLDINLPGWRTDLDEQALQDAKDIVLRKNERPNLLPRQINNKKRNTPELEQEHKDYQKLGQWKNALKGQ